MPWHISLRRIEFLKNPLTTPPDILPQFRFDRSHLILLVFFQIIRWMFLLWMAIARQDGQALSTRQATYTRIHNFLVGCNLTEPEYYGYIRLMPGLAILIYGTYRFSKWLFELPNETLPKFAKDIIDIFAMGTFCVLSMIYRGLELALTV